MSDDMGEFKRQEERFEELSRRFQRIFGTFEKPKWSLGGVWYPGGCSEEIVYSCWISDGSHSVNLFLDCRGRMYKNHSEALRALCDRLELALQGKVKGE